MLLYSLSRKTVNTRENFWNVYCFATSQMRDETAKDNGQTTALISHVRETTSWLFLQFYRFQLLKFFFLDFGFGSIDM